jgi:hypothetical protein
VGSWKVHLARGSSLWDDTATWRVLFMINLDLICLHKVVRPIRKSNGVCCGCLVEKLLLVELRN